MSAEQQQELLDEAERRAEELKALQDRAAAIVATILGASLLAAMPAIRRAYRRYQDALRAPVTDPSGQTYRPAAGTGKIAAKRFAELQSAAAAFASDKDMKRMERELAAVMQAAAEHGTKYAVTMGSIQGLAIGDPVPMAPALIKARISGVVSAVQAQSIGFRGVLSSIAADGATRDRPVKAVERALLEAFRGVKADDGSSVSRGLLQQVEVHVATQVSINSDDQSVKIIRSTGANYVRWITVQDERSCPYCAARHGRIYLADRITIPAHHRCRCGVAAVPDEQVNADPDRRDDVLDSPFWQEEERRTVLTYAAAHNLDEHQARARLNDYLNRPTQADRLRFPGVERAARPSYEPPPYDPATTEVPGL